jgi:hypothetical protein
VLIAVIALIFLGLQLGRKPPAVESKQVANLLHAMLQQTTDCIVRAPEYETMRDLIKSCYKDEKCSNGKTACQSLQETANKLLLAALSDLQVEQPVQAYQFNVSYSTSQFFFGKKPQADILLVSKGKCSGSTLANIESIPIESGDIQVVLRLCY